MGIVKNHKIKNIIQVAFSNISTIVSGVVVGFVLPRIISVEDYGWFKTFSLYTTYSGLFTLGIVDGLALKYGGDDYTKLEKPLFRGYIKSYLGINVIFSLILIIIALLMEDQDYGYILIMLGIYLIMSNVSLFFRQISQVTLRFKDYCISKYIQSGLRILIALCLLVGTIVGLRINYKIYLLIVVFSELIVSLWYVISYKDIVFGFGYSIKTILGKFKSLILLGFPLLMANQCSTFILSLDRQFVRVLFDTETYAVYAFAYTMLSLVTVTTSAIAEVLYPTLKRSDNKSIRNNYPWLVGIVSAVVFMGISCYFPLCIFVEWFLPKYKDSLKIFRIVFPGLAFSSSISVVMHNYYKTLGKNNLYLFKSIIIMVISGLFNWIAFILFRSTIAISVASVITLFIWYLYIDWYFYKSLNYSRMKNLMYLLVMTSVFYCSTYLITNYYIGFVIYFFICFGLTFMFYGEKIKKIIKKNE